MTANSINYARQQEDARHNLITEALAKRERIELERHNTVLEDIGYGSNRETARHNEAMETQNQQSINLQAEKLREERRHNTVLEQQEWSKVTETQRSNLARETETNRSNRAREEETLRSDVAREEENIRHNKATEILQSERQTEELRHNKVMEELDTKQQDIAWYNAYTARESAGASMISAQASKSMTGVAATNAETARLQYTLEFAKEEGQTTLGAQRYKEQAAKSDKAGAEALMARNKARYSDISERAFVVNQLLSPILGPIGKALTK